MTDPANKQLFLVDGSSQMYRAYHAIRGLTGPDGRSTNAVYGFVTMLRKLIADHRPEFIAVAFDLAGPTFRSTLAADYKANRPAMPPDLAEQVPLIHEACDALGVAIVTLEGYEADDVIGTLASRTAGAGVEVAIVTGDKDFYQLVRDHVRVYNPRDDGTWYDVAGVKDKFGVAPDRVVDVLALMGDSVDNVKGVPGIGEKGARELIEAHGSLDELLTNAGSVPQKRYRSALLAHTDDARKSRDLVRIHTDVPVEGDLESMRYRGSNAEKCFALFSSLGFKSLLADFAPAPETLQTVERDYRLVVDEPSLGRLEHELRAAGQVGLAILTDSDEPMRARLVGLALAWGTRRAAYVPVAPWPGDASSAPTPTEILSRLRPILEGGTPTKVGHDLKRSILALRRHGIQLGGATLDTMLASYVLDATRASHRLEDIALDELGYQTLGVDEIRGKGAKALDFGQLPGEAVVDFACEQADLPLQLADRLISALEGDELMRLFEALELPLVPVLVDLELAGVKVDTDALARLSARVEADLRARQTRIHELAGESFNINSPKQLSQILFDKLQLPSLKRTGKTRSASTSVEVLEELALSHELPREILEWRGLQKLKGTYIDALPALVNPGTGRVHTSFNQAVAATGRLSSSDPNLQNIPIRTALGREIREAFVPEPGCVLISADYSQIELRVLAHLSGDATLIASFERGDDIHDQTALRVFGPDSGLEPHELRRRAKIVNYALLYGKTAYTLARDIGVSQHAAQAFIDAYFEGFPAVRAYIDETISRARESGVVSTLFGRRRRVPELTSRNGQLRAAAERVTINLPIQGTAADIIKRAMIDLHGALQVDGEDHLETGRMILTVHDELVLEVREAHAERVARMVRERMEQAVTLRVPLSVDVGIGLSWKAAKG